MAVDKEVIGVFNEVLSSFDNINDQLIKDIDINTAINSTLFSKSITIPMSEIVTSTFVTGVVLSFPEDVSIGLIVLGGAGLYVALDKIESGLKDIYITNNESLDDTISELQTSLNASNIILSYTLSNEGSNLITSLTASKDDTLADVMNKIETANSYIELLDKLGNSLPIEEINMINYNNSTYIVQKDNTIWGICEKYGMSYDELIEANPWLAERFSTDRSFALIRPDESIQNYSQMGYCLI